MINHLLEEIPNKVIEDSPEGSLSDNIDSNIKSSGSPTPRKIEEEKILNLTIDIPQGTQEVLEVKSTDDIVGITNEFKKYSKIYSVKSSTKI